MCNQSTTFKTTTNSNQGLSVSDAKSIANLYGTMGYIGTKYSGNCVVLGDGDAAPTLDDCKLSGNVLSTITYNADVTRENEDGGATITALYTITNTGTEDITIKELGMIYTNGPVMYERTVLDSPVTIPVGGIGQVTYTIRLNYPTA